MNSLLFGCNGSKELIELRFLCPTDVPKVKQLCSDWFPIEYPDSWYEDITSNPKFFALAAVFHFEIIGLIVAEIKPQTKCNREDQGLLASSLVNNSRVVYILTLGVVKEFRRVGIATLLLDNLIHHLTRNESTKDCRALYLHVLTTNLVAIRFYEKRQFKRHLFLPLYYSINSTARDGFSYVLYINGGRPQPTLLYPFHCMKHVYHMNELFELLLFSLTDRFTDYLSIILEAFSRIGANPCKWTKRLLQVMASKMCRFIPMSATNRNSSPHLASL
ncbi:unnamed protein product, partial [Oppiella nova]